MDLKTLKLELLERIALLEDEPRLLALKRLLDGPPTYTLPSEHLSVVKEGGADYLPEGQKLFTLEEVRAIVDAVKEEYQGYDLDDELSPEEIAELHRRDQEMDSGKVKGYTWEEVQAILDGDRRKQRSGK